LRNREARKNVGKKNKNKGVTDKEGVSDLLGEGKVGKFRLKSGGGAMLWGKRKKAT